MKAVSQSFSVGDWKHWAGHKPGLPQKVRVVAKAFVNLQRHRHLADYDNYVAWSILEAHEIIGVARDAAANWATIREHPLAGTYLLAMLLGKGR